MKVPSFKQASSFLAVLAVVLFAVNVGFYVNTPRLCEFPKEGYRTYTAEDVRKPAVAAWNSFHNQSRCFGEVKEGGRYDWARPVAKVMREKAYDSFVFLRMVMAAGVSLASFLLVFMLYDAYRRKAAQESVKA